MPCRAFRKKTCPPNTPSRPEPPATAAATTCWEPAQLWQRSRSKKNWPHANWQGPLRYYGTPAEEGGGGKIYMIHAGLFRDVDAVLTWHPADVNRVDLGSTLANNGGAFRFYGIAAHAAMAPERGRSALDGVMIMLNAVEFLREHVPQETRIHYIISAGGKAPNIVAEEAGRAMIAYARETLRAKALFAGHHPANLASRRVLAKLGFRFTHEEFYPPTGLHHPSYLLAL